MNTSTKIRLSLYLLELEGNNYYVGQTNDLEFRCKQHFSGEGAKWTQLHKPLKFLLNKVIEVENVREAILYENWMTLHYMSKYGWQHVRGGEFLIIEEYQLKEQLKHIFDFDSNHIRYYIKDNRYLLFGATDNWLIYVLELENGKYYIGSTKRLGKALGKHFNGLNVNWTRENKPLVVKEFIEIKPDAKYYLDIKREMLDAYILKYGRENVMGGQTS